MTYIADLHIHSRYSRATSKDGTPEHLDLWARRKGIHIVGSGDFTHPAWREELKEKLMPAEDGLYVLKPEYRIQDGSIADTMIPRFVITGEISSIYKQGGKVRKVHSLIVLPGIEEAEILSEKLAGIGNIHSDGRPILGLSCHDLLEILLETVRGAMFVPAHIWTPHFSMFGAFSGFDSVEECFLDLSSHIHAVETGLSSDPPMNWRVSALDRYQLISNSDAHSPSKLGREANLLDIELSYEGLRKAIEEGDGLCGTIEFFPEEGKYHLDGHRKCGLCLTPAETEKYNGICPVCGKKITVGVSHRVEQLSDRQEGFVRKDAKVYENLMPLPEVIGTSLGYSPASVKVQKEYANLLKHLGAEFDILRTIPEEEIRSVSGGMIAEGIRRLREGKAEKIPGFDGEYGTIRLFRPDERENLKGQMDFFGMLGLQMQRNTKNKEEEETAEGKKDLYRDEKQLDIESSLPEACAEIPGLNLEQCEAVRAAESNIAVIAGPGTGKTKTLVSRIVYLLEHRKIKASEITAVTFTNQAAREMRERIQTELAKGRRIGKMQIGTFHSICLQFLKNQGLDVFLADEEERKEIAKEIIAEYGLSIRPDMFLNEVSIWKTHRGQKEHCEKVEAFSDYEKRKKEKGRMDFDDLLLETLRMIQEKEVGEGWEKPFRYLLVDEFQDISPVQYELIKMWNRAGRELFVIGDPDQAIYGFRGADEKCFERLRKDFKNLKEIRLKENYRSTPEILRAAQDVISENPGKDRTLHSNQNEGVPVRMIETKGKMGEAIFIAKEINRLVGGVGMLEAHNDLGNRQGKQVRGFSDIAVLYRTHRQAELLEKTLKTEGIPYQIAGRESFLEKEEVRGSISFFKYLENPDDDYAKEESVRLLWKNKLHPISEQILKETKEKYEKNYKKQKPNKFMKTWIDDMNLKKSDSMQKLTGMAVCYRTMPEFLNALELGVESDLRRCAEHEYTSETVTLMTLHGSKGLEFPVTIICGVEEGTIPLESENYTTNEEEERRLLYVGMTRAKKELIMTKSGKESIFTKKLDEKTVKKEIAPGKKKPKEQYHQMSLFE